MTIVGYDQENFLVKNSWGENNSYQEINMINGKIPFNVFTSTENPHNQFIYSINFIIRKEDFYKIAKNFHLLLTFWELNDGTYEIRNIWTNRIRPQQTTSTDPEYLATEERNPAKWFRRIRKNASLLTGKSHILDSLFPSKKHGGSRKRNIKRKNIKTKRKKR